MAGFCRRWRICNLALFGSVLRDDFRADSDIDLLVSFEPEARHGLFALARMQHELEALIGWSINILTWGSILASENWIRRKEIVGTARTIYENSG
ncbi:MAG: nucleotidyltransferase domain-containing protein [Cyanobacteria bacterium P01_H01_bin.15]